MTAPIGEGLSCKAKEIRVMMCALMYVLLYPYYLQFIINIIDTEVKNH